MSQEEQNSQFDQAPKSMKELEQWIIDGHSITVRILRQNNIVVASIQREGDQLVMRDMANNAILSQDPYDEEVLWTVAAMILLSPDLAINSTKGESNVSK